MTLQEILAEAKQLSPKERQILIAELQTMPAQQAVKTGSEIAAMIRAMDTPITLVDAEVIDPVDWIKLQREKRQRRISQEL